MPAASVRDVASRAGVSVGTVSNVLNHPDKVAAPTVELVQAAIRELGFVRNDAARQLRAGRSKSIGLVVLDVRNPFFTDLARGAEDAAAQAGLSIILGNSDEDLQRESAYLDLFDEQRVHGVLISPFGDISERLGRLRARGIPAVLVDRASGDNSSSSVSVDDVAGGNIALEHLIERGCSRIAVAASRFDIRQISDRLEGARQAVVRHPGVELEIVTTDGLTVEAGRAAGKRIAERRPADRPDGIFAVNDLIALGVLQALVMQGSVRVPEDIALIGYDDIAFAAAAVVPLTSVRQPSLLLGQTAVEMLLTEAADPDTPHRQVVFQPELVVRQSTALGRAEQNA